MSASPPAAAPSSPDDYGERQRLHPRVKLEWVGGWLIGIGFFLLLDLGGLAFDMAAGGDATPISLVTVALIAAIVAAVVWAQFAYENYWYSLLAEHMVVAKGVFFKTRTYIPYGRIQNVNVTRTVADRVLGLSRITVDTAGARFSEGVVPGIVEPQPLVTFLMNRAEQVRLGRAVFSGDEDREAAAFEAIRSSLRDVLQSARGGGGEGGAP
ncbi:MAG TPA: PH domain-containing protein [Candidatus Thermoplasmatota archaeon]